MDGKWFAIMAVGMFLAMFGAMAIDSMAKSDCKAKAIAAGASVEVIELCNKG